MNRGNFERHIRAKKTKMAFDQLAHFPVCGACSSKTKFILNRYVQIYFDVHIKNSSEKHFLPEPSLAIHCTLQHLCNCQECGGAQGSPRE